MSVIVESEYNEYGPWVEDIDNCDLSDNDATTLLTNNYTHTEAEEINENSHINLKTILNLMNDQHFLTLDEYNAKNKHNLITNTNVIMYHISYSLMYNGKKTKLTLKCANDTLIFFGPNYEWDSNYFLGDYLIIEKISKLLYHYSLCTI